MSEDSEKIRIVGAYSITEEAFENLGDESHMSVFDFVNESIVQEEDQNTVLFIWLPNVSQIACKIHENFCRQIEIHIYFFNTAFWLEIVMNFDKISIKSQFGGFTT